MSLGETIRSGVRWVVAGKFGREALHFAISIALARLLLPEHFGLVITVQIFTGVANFVAGGGMGQALVQTKDLEDRDTHVVFTAQLVIGVALYVFFFFLAPWVAVWFSEPLYKDLMRVSALIFLIRPFVNTPSALLHRAMRFRAKAFVSITVLTVSGSTSIALAVAGFEVWSLVLGGIAGALANVVLAQVVTGWRPGLALDREISARLGTYGIKVSGNDLVMYIRQQVSNLIISRFIGPAAVGLFNKAVSLNAMPAAMISGSARMVVFRALSRTQDNLDQSKYIYLRSITLAAVYTVPCYVGLWWVAESFIYTVYGPNWVEAAPILQILVLTGLFQCVSHQSGAVIAARNLVGKELVIQTFGLVLLTVAAGIGYRWGMMGVAWAVVLVSVVVPLLLARLACRELGVKFGQMWRALQPPLLLNGILAAVLWAVHVLWMAELETGQPALYLLGMVTVGAATYGICFLYLPVPQLRKEASRWKARLHLPVRAEVS